MPPVDENDRKLERGIGRRIREMRVALGLSQSELAERISVTYQQVQKYENGTTHLTISRLIHVAEALSVDLGSLVGRGWSEVGERKETMNERAPGPELTDEELRFYRLLRRLRDRRLRRNLFSYLRLLVEAQGQTGE